MKEKTAINRSRRHGKVKFIVLHDTCGTYPGDLNWLSCKQSGVSADFYVRRNGELWCLNPDLTNTKCWQAGKSAYLGYSNLNEYSVGIEMEHHNASDDWPQVQVDTTARLAAWLLQEFKLDLDAQPIVSHAQIAIPKGRKSDPRSFPWSDFYGQLRVHLGHTTESALLMWGITAQPINVELKFVSGSTMADADDLVAATGLSLIVPESQDGLVSVRRFFESHGYRVEWNAEKREVEVLPQD
jgi:N-acetyl-anhydromuramyl-L-alanine amidase AmpD